MLIPFEHSPYIEQVIMVAKCPTCYMPKNIDCVGRITHEKRLIKYYELTGLSVDATYEFLKKKPKKIRNC